MIHISKVMNVIEQQLASMQPQQAVQFKTYKRDRGFMIYCVNAQEFQLLEFGFNHALLTGDADCIYKHAKKCLRREFPRSNQVWVEYFEQLASVQAQDQHNPKQASLFE
ncbi:MAG: hypothetical protein ACRCT7_00710 [Shewanella sp.]